MCPLPTFTAVTTYQSFHAVLEIEVDTICGFIHRNAIRISKIVSKKTDTDQGSSQEIRKSSNETSCPPLLFVGANKAVPKYAWLSTYTPLRDGGAQRKQSKSYLKRKNALALRKSSGNLIRETISADIDAGDSADRSVGRSDRRANSRNLEENTIS